MLTLGVVRGYCLSHQKDNEETSATIIGSSCSFSMSRHRTPGEVAGGNDGPLVSQVSLEVKR